MVQHFQERPFILWIQFLQSWTVLMTLCEGADFFADPSLNYDLCETRNEIEVLVCNADSVLNTTQVSELEDIILKIRNDTMTPCANSTIGYTVRVFFYQHSNNINDTSTVTIEDLRNEALVRHNLLLSDIDCDTDILLLIDYQTKKAVSVAGQNAIPFLPDDVQILILANASSLLENNDVFSAVSFILRHFGSVLGKDHSSTISPSFSNHRPQVSQASRRALTIVSVIAVLTIALLGLGGCIYRWKRKPPPHDPTDYTSSRDSLDTLDAFTTIELSDVATSKQSLQEEKSEEIERL